MARKAKVRTGKLSIADMRSMINKKAGISVAHNLTEDNPTEVKQWIPTGSRWLDSIVCRGRLAGIPVGKVSEIAGLEASGKSYMAAQVAANAQKMGIPEESVCELRYDLLKEENEEYLQACKDGDIVEVADALGDILYIAYGSLLKHGLQDKIEEVFCEIHRSNMSKLDKDGNPIYRADGKVLKGENYFKPDIKKVLQSDS